MGHDITLVNALTETDPTLVTRATAMLRRRIPDPAQYVEMLEILGLPVPEPAPAAEGV